MARVRSRFRIPILRAWRLPDATLRLGRAGKPGGGSTGRRKPPARKRLGWSRKRWSSCQWSVVGSQKDTRRSPFDSPSAALRISRLGSDLAKGLTNAMRSPDPEKNADAYGRVMEGRECPALAPKRARTRRP